MLLLTFLLVLLDSYCTYLCCVLRVMSDFIFTSYFLFSLPASLLFLFITIVYNLKPLHRTLFTPIISCLFLSYLFFSFPFLPLSFLSFLFFSFFSFVFISFHFTALLPLFFTIIHYFWIVILEDSIIRKQNKRNQNSDFASNTQPLIYVEDIRYGSHLFVSILFVLVLHFVLLFLECISQIVYIFFLSVYLSMCVSKYVYVCAHAHVRMHVRAFVGFIHEKNIYLMPCDLIARRLHLVLYKSFWLSICLFICQYNRLFIFSQFLDIDNEDI